MKEMRNCVGFVPVYEGGALCDHLNEDGTCAFFTEEDLETNIMCDAEDAV